MNANDLLDIIGESADKFVRESHESSSSNRKRKIFNIAIGAAACIVLAPMVLLGGMSLFLGGMGSSAPAPGAADSEMAAPAEPAAPAAPYSGFDNYLGPVMALTSLDDSSGISVRRDLDISFAPLYEENYSFASVELIDNYLLTNTSGEDIQLNLAYPYVSSYYDALSSGEKAELMVNGIPTEGEMVYGPYTGSFIPVYGAEDDPEMGTSNLSGPNDYSDYITLLTDGSYLMRSFEDAPKLEQKVTVYKLSDYEFTSDADATNPTLKFSYHADSSKTTVLTWNFNGGSNFDEEGYYERHAGRILLRPEAAPENIYPDDAYIIVLGDDISAWEVHGYRNGGCEAGDELSDLGCSVTRYETTLEKILRALIESGSYFGNEIDGDTDTLYRICAIALMDFGPIGSEPVTRYSYGMLDEFIYDVCTHKRIAYLSFPLTVPAGESIEVSICSKKALSHNYYGMGDTDMFRFDFAGNHGSNLDFSSVHISLSDYEGIELISDCFGFDLNSGISELEFTHEELSRWYIDIRK